MIESTGHDNMIHYTSWLIIQHNMIHYTSWLIIQHNMKVIWPTTSEELHSQSEARWTNEQTGNLYVPVLLYSVHIKYYMETSQPDQHLLTTTGMVWRVEQGRAHIRGWFRRRSRIVKVDFAFSLVKSEVQVAL
jgi:hypothetical protein